MIWGWRGGGRAGTCVNIHLNIDLWFDKRINIDILSNFHINYNNNNWNKNKNKNINNMTRYGVQVLVMVQIEGAWGALGEAVAMWWPWRHLRREIVFNIFETSTHFAFCLMKRLLKKQVQAKKSKQSITKDLCLQAKVQQLRVADQQSNTTCTSNWVVVIQRSLLSLDPAHWYKI